MSFGDNYITNKTEVSDLLEWLALGEEWRVLIQVSYHFDYMSFFYLTIHIIVKWTSIFFFIN